MLIFDSHRRPWRVSIAADDVARLRIPFHLHFGFFPLHDELAIDPVATSISCIDIYWTRIIDASNVRCTAELVFGAVRSYRAEQPVTVSSPDQDLMRRALTPWLRRCTQDLREENHIRLSGRLLQRLSSTELLRWCVG